MDEAPVKKEIVVKRLSAFKFAVEVNEKEQQVAVARESVIQRAPPATPSPTTTTPPPLEPVLIRHAILERVVELLLWKLLGGPRLKAFCGYPTAPTCTLLQRVLQLSAHNEASSSAARALPECNGSMGCFLKQVSKFLEICAPSAEVWHRFGWDRLSEEAILRKIYENELSPNMRAAEFQYDQNILKTYESMQLLLHWEQLGFTAITRGQGKQHLSPLLPRTPWPGQKVQPMPSPYPPPRKMVRRASLVESAGVDGRGKMAVSWGSRVNTEIFRSDPAWTRQPRPYSHFDSIRFHESPQLSRPRPTYRPYPHQITADRHR